MIIPKGGSPTKKSFPKLWILKVKSTKTIRPIKRLLPKVIPEFCEFILKEQIVLKISGFLSQTSFASFASFVTFDRIEDWNLWLIYGHWRWRVLGEEKDKKEEKTIRQHVKYVSRWAGDILSFSLLVIVARKRESRSCMCGRKWAKEEKGECQRWEVVRWLINRRLAVSQHNLMSFPTNREGVAIEWGRGWRWRSIALSSC